MTQSSARITSDALSATRLTLNAIQASTDTFPPLKSSVNVVLVIMDLSQRAKSNKKGCEHIANRSAQLVQDIWRQTKDFGVVLPEEVERSVVDIENLFKEIESFLGGLETEKAWKRFVRQDLHKSQVAEYERLLDEAMMMFSTNLELSIYRLHMESAEADEKSHAAVHCSHMESAYADQKRHAAVLNILQMSESECLQLLTQIRGDVHVGKYAITSFFFFLFLFFDSQHSYYNLTPYIWGVLAMLFIFLLLLVTPGSSDCGQGSPHITSSLPSVSGLEDPSRVERVETQASHGNPKEIKITTGTFAIYSPQDEEPETEYASFPDSDLTCVQTNLGMGGCLKSAHEPAEAASWMENRCEKHPGLEDPSLVEHTGTQASHGSPEEIKIATGTFIICSPQDEEPETQHTSFTENDLTCVQTKLGMGGCLISAHEPAEAASWIENNWDKPLVTSIRNSGCGGPLAWMLSPSEPALAIFGCWDNPMIVNMAQSLAEVSGFPAVIRPTSDNPALTLLTRDTDPDSGSVQVGNTASDHETRHSGDDEDDEAVSEDERTPEDSRDGGRSDDNDHGSADPNGQGSNTVGEHEHHGCIGGQGSDGGGDGDGGGPTSIGGKWESQLHRTRIKLQLKLNTVHTYDVTIGYTFKFAINRETEIPIDLANLTRPLSQPEVIALLDYKIETRPRETQIDRSYASIGFVAHRRESIIEREFLHRGFDLPDKIYRHGQQQQIQRGTQAAVGFSEGSPLATATFSYNRNNAVMLEAADSKVMPRCRVHHETGAEWDKEDKSYSSYNIAYQLQDTQLNAARSEFHPLEVKVGMGINLQPAGSEKPLPQISFVNRNQVLIWVSDPTSKAQIRGVVVLMSSYLDNIRTEEKTGHIRKRRD
ncbi:hypothetical protein B0H14DRAFT_3879711 [Mycena olivaceomarginata]|nr:hypothetical protein B0H14DRAFT_3879711 [Mycena olivaceomarginata]